MNLYKIAKVGKFRQIWTHCVQPTFKNRIKAATPQENILNPPFSLGKGKGWMVGGLDLQWRFSHSTLGSQNIGENFDFDLT